MVSPELQNTILPSDLGTPDSPRRRKKSPADDFHVALCDEETLELLPAQFLPYLELTLVCAYKQKISMVSPEPHS